MRHEPPIDRAALAEAVRAAYGLAPASLTFVPVGYAAACYDVRDDGGRRRFLKLWPATGAGRAAAGRLEETLPLLVALAGQGIRVPAPLPTRQGELAASFAGQPFALFPFVVGRAPPPWSAWPPALRAELGRAVAAIHLATPTLASLLPARDRLETTFEAELRRGLAALERLERGARPGQRALRESVLPRAGEVLVQLDRLAALRAIVQRAGAPLVLCHTDIGGDNLRLDRAGRLTVLDWDEATLAPPEHDLQDLRGPALADIVVAYLAAGGVRPPRGRAAGPLAGAPERRRAEAPLGEARLGPPARPGRRRRQPIGPRPGRAGGHAPALAGRQREEAQSGQLGAAAGPAGQVE